MGRQQQAVFSALKNLAMPGKFNNFFTRGTFVRRDDYLARKEEDTRDSLSTCSLV